VKKPRRRTLELGWTRDQWSLANFVFRLGEALVEWGIEVIRERIRWTMVDGPRAISRWEDDGGRIG
jgi:hypothetical protein